MLGVHEVLEAHQTWLWTEQGEQIAGPILNSPENRDANDD